MIQSLCFRYTKLLLTIVFLAVWSESAAKGDPSHAFGTSLSSASTSTSTTTTTTTSASAATMQDSIPAKPESAIPWYSSDMFEDPFVLEPNYLDTTFMAFQLYDYFYPGNALYTTKGNVGMASRLLQYGLGTINEFQLFNVDPYQQNRFMHEDIKFFRPKHVFTDLYYVTGANREQLFYAKHAQRLHERIVVNGNYRLVNSPGTYSRMGSRNSNVYLTADVQDPNERYQLVASLAINRFEQQQSGGLKNHLAFEDNPVRDSVYLYRAVSRYRETALHLSHFYRTGFFIRDSSPGDVSGGDTLQPLQLRQQSGSDPEIQDSLIMSLQADKDSIVEEVVSPFRKFVSLGRIAHQFIYHRRIYTFEDQNRPYPFFPVAPYNETATFDSTVVNTLENQLSWSNYPSQEQGKRFPVNVKLSLTHRFVEIRQPNYADPNDADNGEASPYPMNTYAFNQIEPGVHVRTDSKRLLSFDANAMTVLGGYNSGDFNVSGSVWMGRANHAWRFQAAASVSGKEAAYFLSQYTGNYISWDNDFAKQTQLHVAGRIHHARFKLFANYFLLNNMVFMNAQAVPEQNQQVFSIISAGISGHAGIGILQSRHQLLYQYVGHDRYERFPALASYHSIFADFNLFDKALFLQIGVDAYVNTAYKPMAYMPVVWQFYAQDEYMQDFTVLADVFLTARVKRTRFFLKLQNVAGVLNQGLPVYTIPFYPLPETALKFGLSWMFFD